MPAVFKYLTLFIAAALLAACTPPPETVAPPARGAPASFPLTVYQRAAAAGKPVYRVDSGASKVTIYVYSGGPLGSAFGHNHVVSTSAVNGYVESPGSPTEGRADLYFAADTLEVNNPGDSREAGFESRLSPQQLRATRAHMLNDVLETARYPYVSARVNGGAQAGSQLQVRITLHGRQRTLTVPAQLRVDAQQVQASGQFHITHSEFGMTPYSVLGGGLTVKDGLDIRFVIRAVRVNRVTRPASDAGTDPGDE